MRCETIIDVALRLLTNKNGKVLTPISLNKAIEDAQAKFNDGVEFVRLQVVEPLKTKVEAAPKFQVINGDAPFNATVLGDTTAKLKDGIEKARLRLIEGEHLYEKELKLLCLVIGLLKRKYLN